MTTEERSPRLDPAPGECCKRCRLYHGEAMRAEPFAPCVAGEHSTCSGCAGSWKHWRACGCECHRREEELPKPSAIDAGATLRLLRQTLQNIVDSLDSGGSQSEAFASEIAEGRAALEGRTSAEAGERSNDRDRV